jgi:phage terminase large subunit-like protein
VRGAWNKNFIRQAAGFPKGRHDDMVDFVSGSVQMMAEGVRIPVSKMIDFA